MNENSLDDLIPKDRQPKERLLLLGAEMLTDLELISLLLAKGSEDKNSMELAGELLNEAGSLRELRMMSLEEMSQIKGISADKGARVLAGLELGKRASLEDKRFMPLINSTLDVLELMADEMRSLENETVKLLLLNSKHRLIHITTISLGGVNYSSAHPREVYKAAVKFASSGLILVHNHPSGDFLPSEQDITITRRLVEAGEIMGIPLLDHIIIAETGYYSFSEENIIKY